ncbi:MAG TPA: hypothetical protein VNH82_09330 [Candidatus Dormibacteraeota bacterium]|nr:hypothetical protein [Candidatus Dormibacteraeota bacterium]
MTVKSRADENQSPLYGRSEIVAMANSWAVERGWPAVSEQAVIDWKKDALLPKVGSRALGRGKGTTGLWDDRSYIQLQRVIELRAAGMRRRSRMRLHLWIEGYDVPWTRVRGDLEGLLGPSIRASNAELGTDRWGDQQGTALSERARHAIERHLVGRPALGKALMEFGLPEVLATRLANWAQRPEVKDILTHWAYHLFSPDSPALQVTLAQVAQAVPDPLKPLLSPPEGLLDMFAGVLAPTSSGSNRAWLAARKADERLIANVGDLARNFDDLWRSSFRVAAAFVLEGGSGVPSWAVPPIAGALHGLAALQPLRTNDNKILLAGLLLNRRRNLEDHGDPLGVMGRALAPLFEWLAEHPDVIALSQKDPRAAEEQLLAAPLPEETKRMVMEEGRSGERVAAQGARN